MKKDVVGTHLKNLPDICFHGGITTRDGVYKTLCPNLNLPYTEPVCKQIYNLK